MIMKRPAKRTISAYISVDLAAAVESLAIELGRSKNRVIEEALIVMIEQENGGIRGF